MKICCWGGGGCSPSQALFFIRQSRQNLYPNNTQRHWHHAVLNGSWLFFRFWSNLCPALQLCGWESCLPPEADEMWGSCSMSCRTVLTFFSLQPVSASVSHSRVLQVGHSKTRPPLIKSSTHMLPDRKAGQNSPNQPICPHGSSVNHALGVSYGRLCPSATWHNSYFFSEAWNPAWPIRTPALLATLPSIYITYPLMNAHDQHYCLSLLNTSWYFNLAVGLVAVLLWASKDITECTLCAAVWYTRWLTMNSASLLL